MTPIEIMRMAIAQAEGSQTPYGAVIVKDGKMVAQAGNSVERDADPAAHAEVNAIRKLTRSLKTPSLEGGYTLYSTCEPCAMCAAICFWSGISEIVYGVGADDFEDGYNPNAIDVRCEEIIGRSPHPIPIKAGILKEECKHLHTKYPL